MIAGVLCAAAGIACFLAVSRPGGGQRTVGLEAALPLVMSLAAVLAVCLVAARWGPRRPRAIWLAIACGADFGVSAFLLKIAPDTLAQGFGDPVRQWPLYLLVVVGPAGFLLNQSAFQAGVLIAPVLAIITALDPLVSIGIARVWLDESFASSPADLAAEALALAIMTGGIVALAYRAPQVARKEAEAVSPRIDLTTKGSGPAPPRRTP
jgi:drug/metabolite transporter (DMT)-like permease